MKGLLGAIADAALPGANDANLAAAVGHFWENRRLARIILAPPLGTSVRRLLESLVEERLNGEQELARTRAVQIAAAQLALLDAWTRGELTASEARITDRLHAAGQL